MNTYLVEEVHWKTFIPTIPGRSSVEVYDITGLTPVEEGEYMYFAPLVWTSRFRGALKLDRRRVVDVFDKKLICSENLQALLLDICSIYPELFL